MTETEALELIHACPRFQHGEAARRMPRLLELLDHPEKGLPFVHVTGTNGKGSFSAMTASMLAASGKKTGLFISPYIVDFKERMQINGRNIPGDTLARLVEQSLPALRQMEQEGRPANEFMWDLALALLWFREEGTDIAVIEAGVGGASDATIAIGKPVLSAIMGIGLEHTRSLGPTIADIARDKAGIIKGNPALLYPEQPPEAVEEVMKRCAETGAQLHMPALAGLEVLSEGFTGSRFRCGGESYFCPLAGRHQIKNAVTAITAGELLGLSRRQIRDGLYAVQFPARMQCLSLAPPVILDGAHNPHGMQALCESIQAFAAGQPVYALTGMMADKAVEKNLAILGGIASRIIAVTPDTPRAMESGELREIAARFCPEAVDGGWWKDGLAYARAAAQADGALLLICGSLYLAGDVLRG